MVRTACPFTRNRSRRDVSKQALKQRPVRCSNAKSRTDIGYSSAKQIPRCLAEYVLLRHYLAEPVDTVREAKIGNYLRRIQGAHGGWPLFHNGDFDMSASVKAYFGLKMIGDFPDAPHMVRARDAIRARGGASRANVFTRILLALFGFIPWRALPLAPVEIMLLPSGFPFTWIKSPIGAAVPLRHWWWCRRSSLRAAIPSAST